MVAVDEITVCNYNRMHFTAVGAGAFVEEEDQENLHVILTS